ncbi:MAG: type II toxin-antitoxin system RelE/ParE family toxin [Saprospiraceae bacterium]|nr:type II toxin-antitoxin system RelE/ParE family toxin [Saprospiraceae bacterium]
MANYKLSNTAKEDLIRIYLYGVQRFGISQADKYFNQFFNYFEKIADNLFFFKAVDYIRNGYRRCLCGSDSIYFRLKSNEVEIMAIVGSQDLNIKL